MKTILNILAMLSDNHTDYYKGERYLRVGTTLRPIKRNGRLKLKIIK